MKSFIAKIFAFLLLIGFISSCSSDALREYDTSQELDAVESLNDPYLLSSIIKKTALFYQDQGYETTQLPGAVQYIVRNYQGSDNYYNAFKSANDKMYDAMDILKFIESAISLTKERDSKTHQGIFTIFRVLLFSYMTDFYGDVYYFEALKGREGILYPKYDAQEDIYNGLLAELDDAITLINEGTESISSTYDLIYAGEKDEWLKFANSVKLRMLMRASAKMDVASEMASIVSSGVYMSGTGDNAAISYIGNTADDSWPGGTLNWTTDNNFDLRRPSKTLVDTLTMLNDPRLSIWFAPIEQPWTTDSDLDGVSFTTTDDNGYSYTSDWEYLDLTNSDIANVAANIRDLDKVYAGFIAGMAADFKNGNGHYNTDDGGVTGNYKVSKFSSLFRENEHDLLKAMIMNSDEVQFILAEAAVKGYISGDADTYYRNGITLSMQRWGISDAKISTYLAQSSTALPSSISGRLEKIAVQKWIGLFLVATEAYLDLRRTQLPYIFDNGYLVNYDFPLRFMYPSDESAQNTDAYNAGVATLSPAVDAASSKIWLLQ